MLIQIILSIFLCILVTYLFGFLLNILLFSKLLKNQSSTTVFHSSIFTGFMSLTILMALITTLGNTVVILTLLPIGFLIYHNFSYPCFSKQEILSHLKGSSIPFFFTYLAGLICFLFLMLKYDFFSEEAMNMFWTDNGFYINVAEYIINTGREDSASWYSLYKSYSYSMFEAPYHYGELHLYNYTSFANVCSIAPLFYYTYVFSSCLGAFTYSVLHLLINFLLGNTSRYEKYILPFFLVFCVPVTYYFTPLEFLVVLSPKCFFLLPLLCVAIINLFKEKYINSISLFVLLPIFQILYAPAVYTTVFFLAVILFFIYKKENKKIFKNASYYGFFISISLALSILAYYYSYFVFLRNTDTSSHIFIASTDSPIWRQAWDFTKENIWYWAMYVLVVLLYKLGLKQVKYKLLFVFVCIFPFLQIVFGQILIQLKMPEAGQLYVLLSPIIALLFGILFYILFTYYKERRIFSQLMLLFIIANSIASFCHFQNRIVSVDVNRNFVHQLQDNTTSIKNKMGLYYGSKTEALDHYPHLLYLVGNILKSIGEDFWALSVNYRCSIYEIENCPKDKENPKSFPIPLSMVKNTPYYKFYQAKKDIITNETDLQLAFIEEMKIEFVFAVSLEEIPLKIREKAKTIIVDPKSKTTFLILK